jgi:hypothetical protein
MIKHYRSQISIVTLFICLCMGSLVGLPMGDILGVSSLEMIRIELENDNPYEHSESDDEHTIKIYRATSDEVLASKSRSTNFVFQDYLLAPVSPPPKHA